MGAQPPEFFWKPPFFGKEGSLERRRSYLPYSLTASGPLFVSPSPYLLAPAASTYSLAPAPIRQPKPLFELSPSHYSIAPGPSPYSLAPASMRQPQPLFISPSHYRPPDTMPHAWVTMHHDEKPADWCITRRNCLKTCIAGSQLACFQIMQAKKFVGFC